MTTAAYIRVSTEKQSLESQRHAIKKWAERESVDIGDWYEDDGECGFDLHRPAFTDLQTKIIDGKCDRVVFAAIDRFARNLIDGLIELHKWQGLGIKIVFVAENIEVETGSWAGNLFLQITTSILLMMAEAERERIRMRVKTGIEASRNKPLIAAALIKAGHSITQVAGRMNVQAETVKRMLAEPDKHYWGGRKKGVGRKPGVTAERILGLRQKGLRPCEIQRILRISTATYYRRLEEGRASAQRRQQIRDALAPDSGQDGPGNGDRDASSPEKHPGFEPRPDGAGS
jgi:DNA invertase Pin-like site-specific DNA recombinase